jgi:hypothetical protein
MNFLPPLSRIAAPGVLSLGVLGCTCGSLSRSSPADAAASAVAPGPSAPGGFELVTANLKGEPSNGLTYFPSISDDGNFVAFSSFATDLVDVKDDPDGVDVFLRDRKAKKTLLISRGYDGGPAIGGSFAPQVSRDGRFVIFESRASNLVPKDKSVASNVYLHEVVAKKAEVVGSPFENAHAPAISGDGRFVAYIAMMRDGRYGVVRIDRRTREKSEISKIPGLVASQKIDIKMSADGSKTVYGARTRSEDERGVTWATRIALFDTAKNATSEFPLPPQYVDRHSGYFLNISPDGRYVCVTPYQFGLRQKKFWIHHVEPHLVIDLQKKHVELKEDNPDGFPPSRAPYFPGISGNGEYLVLLSGTSPLVPHESLTGQIYLVGLKKYFSP